jgi:predicted ATPase
VCGDDGDVVLTVTALEERNLVQLTASEPEPRLIMLETIREYAAERLRAAGEAEAVHARHADFLLTLAESAEPELPESSGELLDRLEREHDNIRAAIAFLESTGDHDRVIRLVGAIWRFWYLRGHLREGRVRLETALEHHAATKQALTAACEHLEPATYDEAWERGQALTLREAVAFALDASAAERR